MTGNFILKEVSGYDGHENTTSIRCISHSTTTQRSLLLVLQQSLLLTLNDHIV
jgi:hypothetical protein